MSSEGNGQPVRYRIDQSGVTKKEYDAARNLAMESGHLEEFDRAWQATTQRLQTDPWKFGELVRVFKHLDLHAHVGFVRPLMVRFAIHENPPFVILMSIEFVFP